MSEAVALLLLAYRARSAAAAAATATAAAAAGEEKPKEEERKGRLRLGVTMAMMSSTTISPQQPDSPRDVVSKAGASSPKKQDLGVEVCFQNLARARAGLQGTARHVVCACATPGLNASLKAALSDCSPNAEIVDVPRPLDFLIEEQEGATTFYFESTQPINAALDFIRLLRKSEKKQHQLTIVAMATRRGDEDKLFNTGADVVLIILEKMKFLKEALDTLFSNNGPHLMLPMPPSAHGTQKPSDYFAKIRCRPPPFASQVATPPQPKKKRVGRNDRLINARIQSYREPPKASRRQRY